MLRIGICDDESRARDALRLMLEKILRNHEDKIIYDFSSGEGVTKWLQSHPGEIDLLFLDVEMGQLSGMDAAKRIREYDTDLMIVFVTGYTDFVFDGYEVSALDYIVKPAQKEKLLQVIYRAKEVLKNRRPQTYIVQNTEGVYRITKEEILYFYSEKRLVNLVTSKKEYSFYGKLDEVEEQLAEPVQKNDEFIRIHQRYLIRAGAVHKLEQNKVEIGGQLLPISRSYKQQAVMSIAKKMLTNE